MAAAVRAGSVVHLPQRPEEHRLARVGDRLREPGQVRIALAERDRAGADRPAGTVRHERDVRPVAEGLQEVAVWLAPGAALVPADERDAGVGVLARHPVEARDVPEYADGQVASGAGAAR